MHAKSADGEDFGACARARISRALAADGITGGALTDCLARWPDAGATVPTLMDLAFLLNGGGGRMLDLAKWAVLGGETPRRTAADHFKAAEAAFGAAMGEAVRRLLPESLNNRPWISPERMSQPLVGAEWDVFFLQERICKAFSMGALEQKGAVFDTAWNAWEAAAQAIPDADTDIVRAAAQQGLRSRLQFGYFRSGHPFWWLELDGLRLPAATRALVWRLRGESAEEAIAAIERAFMLVINAQVIDMTPAARTQHAALCPPVDPSLGEPEATAVLRLALAPATPEIIAGLALAPQASSRAAPARISGRKRGIVNLVVRSANKFIGAVTGYFDRCPVYMLDPAREAARMLGRQLARDGATIETLLDIFDAWVATGASAPCLADLSFKLPAEKGYTRDLVRRSNARRYSSLWATEYLSDINVSFWGGIWKLAERLYVGPWEFEDIKRRAEAETGGKDPVPGILFDAAQYAFDYVLKPRRDGLPSGWYRFEAAVKAAGTAAVNDAMRAGMRHAMVEIARRNYSETSTIVTGIEDLQAKFAFEPMRETWRGLFGLDGVAFIAAIENELVRIETKIALAPWGIEVARGASAPARPAKPVKKVPRREAPTTEEAIAIGDLAMHPMSREDLARFPLPPA
jgi:hypothetical protein